MLVRTTALGIAVLLGPVGLAGLVGCDGSGPPAAVRSVTATPSPAEDGCARVVSAIGFAEFVLLPRGREGEQVFDGAVRGRLAYVEGSVVMFGEYLPADLRDRGEKLRAEAKRMVSARTPHAEQVAALRDYRKTADALVAACRSAS